MRFFRCIRLDDSDTRIYERVAVPGEWAIPGSFAFLDADPQTLDGKRLQAFRQGFLGTSSFGWTTLVEVDEISPAELEAVVHRLAEHFVERYGAPSLEEALPVARQEAEFASDLDDQPPHTWVALERDFGDEGIVERLRVVQQTPGTDHSAVRLWGAAED